jgi:hypothetical protein
VSEVNSQILIAALPTKIPYSTSKTTPLNDNRIEESMTRPEELYPFQKIRSDRIKPNRPQCVERPTSRLSPMLPKWSSITKVKAGTRNAGHP